MLVLTIEDESECYSETNGYVDDLYEKIKDNDNLYKSLVSRKQEELIVLQKRENTREEELIEKAVLIMKCIAKHYSIKTKNIKGDADRAVELFIEATLYMSDLNQICEKVISEKWHNLQKEYVCKLFDNIIQKGDFKILNSLSGIWQ